MLRRAIESAKYAGEDMEIIVVDDGSTDDTASMCRAMTGIIYVRLDRNLGGGRGGGPARNAGILKSTGKFLTFLDDDDLRMAGSVDRQANLLDQDENLGFVYGQVHTGDSERCEPTGDIRPSHCPTGDVFAEFLKRNFVFVPSVLVRRRAIDAVGLFDPFAAGSEDWDMWIRLAATHAVGALQEPVAIYRDFTPTSGQVSSNVPRMCKSAVYTLAKALNSPRAREIAPEIRLKMQSDRADSLWEYLMREGRNAISRNDFRYAARNYITAIRLNPARAWRLRGMANFMLDIMMSIRAKLR
jgi:glycosyltransferase involved in cell wall biosynthesis